MIETYKDLEKVLKLARKMGVTELAFGGVSFKLGDMPERNSPAGSIEEESSDPLENFPTGELTPEELTFFANGGLPEDNPYRKEQ